MALAAARRPAGRCRCFALIRALFIVLALVTHEAAEAPSPQPDRFAAVVTLGAAYAIVLLVLAIRRPEPLLAWQRLALVDLALVAGLVIYTGGPESPLRFAFCALPFLVAFVASPGRLALWSLSMIACFVVIRHGLPVPRDARYEGPTLAETTGLAFALLAPMAISAVLRRLHGAAEHHASVATTLAADLVRAEDRERRKLADALHAGAVQEIAAGSREIAAALRGDDASLEAACTALDTALGQLRGEIFDLDPTFSTTRIWRPPSSNSSTGRPSAAASARRSSSTRRRSTSMT